MLGIVSSVFDQPHFDADLAYAKRPQVPARLREEGFHTQPAPELEAWIREVFIEYGSPLFNYEHEHLETARIGVLWTNLPMKRHGIEVTALTELPKPQGHKWAKARADMQLAQWFGDVNLAFLITFYGPACHTLSDGQFCALCEHELLHCAQKVDGDGEPVEDEDGNRTFILRGHDVEEFVSVVQRYGAGNAAGMTAQLVAAANRGPDIEAVDIRRCCGNCIK